jgi:hypothetical protein
MTENKAKKPIAKKPIAKKPIAKKPIAKKPIAKKPIAKKPMAKTEKEHPKKKKYIGRDNIKDKSIKINISTGGKSSNFPPPSVSVYPQIQSQPAQHLIIDRYDKTPLIDDDKIGASNLLLQTLSSHEKKLDDLNRMFRASHFDTQQLINNSTVTTTEQPQETDTEFLQPPLSVQTSDLSKPSASVMFQRIKPPQLIEDELLLPFKKEEAEIESKEDNEQLNKIDEINRRIAEITDELKGNLTRKESKALYTEKKKLDKQLELLNNPIPVEKPTKNKKKKNKKDVDV